MRKLQRFALCVFVALVLVTTVAHGQAYSVLYNFGTNSGGGDPEQPSYSGIIAQGRDGNLYGDTSRGGTGNVSPCVTNGCGVFYGFSNGLGAFASLVTKAAKVGKTITILGQGFKGTTGVSFNGTPATFTATSNTYLKAKVPVGATTGPVAVMTSGGTLISSQDFIVLP